MIICYRAMSCSPKKMRPILISRIFITNNQAMQLFVPAPVHLIVHKLVQYNGYCIKLSGLSLASCMSLNISSFSCCHSFLTTKSSILQLLLILCTQAALQMKYTYESFPAVLFYSRYIICFSKHAIIFQHIPPYIVSIHL